MKKQPTISEQFWKRVSRFPPILCRLLARHRYGPPLTNEEIAQRSGLPLLYVAALSQETSWDVASLRAFRQFTRGCGVDLLDSKIMRRIEGYLSKRPVSFKYLRTSPQWTTTFKPLLARYVESQTRK